MPTVSLRTLFDRKIFRIPDYQRGYAWQLEQIKDLWEDLINLQDDRYHYAGVLTLERITRENINEDDNEYWLVADHNYTLYQVIDGQQRLTTFILFFQSLIDFAKQLPGSDQLNDNEFFITGTLSIKDLTESYLFKENPLGARYRTYKFGYTADNPSHDYLRYRIFSEAGAGEVDETFYTLNLSNAKRYFFDQFQALYQQEGLPGIARTFEKLTTRLMLNEYIIEDNFDVFVAFETMNNRGKKLSGLELLKNRLIYLSALFNNDELGEDGRRNLREGINSAWKEVYHQLGKKRTRPLNDDDFLRAHWIMYFKYSRETSRAYLKYLLDEQFALKRVYREAGRVVSSFEKPEELSSEVDYDYEESENGDVSEEIATNQDDQLLPINIGDYVNHLKESAVFWFNSFNPFRSEEMKDEEKEWIDRLNRLGMYYFRPLVMAVLKKPEKEAGDRIRIFKSIERFIFIAFKMMANRSSYGNTEFSNAAREYDRNEISAQAIVDKLNERLSYCFESDNENKLRDDDFYNLLYKKFKSGDGYWKWSGLKYFLFEYEQSLYGYPREPKVNWVDLLNIPKDSISIEHIFPQTDTEDEWPEFQNVVAEKRYYKGSLGNLLLLSSSINSSLQNGSFKEKKGTIRNEKGEIIRNGYSSGSYSEIEVSEQDSWGPQQIEERGERLLSFMERRWNFKFKEDRKKKLLFLDS